MGPCGGFCYQCTSVVGLAGAPPVDVTACEILNRLGTARANGVYRIPASKWGFDWRGLHRQPALVWTGAREMVGPLALASR